jgi:hypothetical protein
MRRALVVLLLLVTLSVHAQQKKVLFDAMHAQTASNADWVLDEDQCDKAQRFPTPDQATITASTPETVWSGAFSAFGVDLVKKGFHVESLPLGSRVTFNDASNLQDLRHYDVYVIPEPNRSFTAAEAAAVRDFVQAGGGVLLIADHTNSDRDNDGFDAPRIFNDMGTEAAYGIRFETDKNDRPRSWFNDEQSRFTSDGTSPILHGPFGTVTQPIGLFGSTSMRLSGNAKGHIWRSNGTPDTNEFVTFATSTLGSGRVAAVGDSSPAEDATNTCNHNTHPGYTETRFDNKIIFSNAIAWLAEAGGAPPPVSVVRITAPVNGETVTGTITVSVAAPAPPVELLVDGVLLATKNVAPFTFTWNTTTVADGRHELTARTSTATSAPVAVMVRNTTAPQPQGIDVGGWSVTQANATIRFTIPNGTMIPANGCLVIGRDATQAEFEAHWGAPLPQTAIYVNARGAFPQINGAEKYTVRNAANAVIDGPTIALSASRNAKRKDPCVAAGTTANWTVSPLSNATPGVNPAAGCAKGVVISEMSDATNFRFEFVELHNDQ